VRIRLSDPAAIYRLYRDEMDEAIRRVLQSGEFVMGPDVGAFEREFAAYCGTAYCIGVLSGTDALHFLLRAHGVGPGDEVITAVNSDIATSLSIEHTGARPVWVDIEAGTFNIDPALVEGAITPRTRAIVAVHMYGLPAAMDALGAIAGRHNLLLFEDAALAAGARYRSRRAGALAAGAAFSLAQGKVLGALGTGGAVTTDAQTIAARVNSLRYYGRSDTPYRAERAPGSPPGVTVRLGFNSRLDSLQAAALRVRLRHLDDEVARRRELAAIYDTRLQGTDVVTPVVPQACTHVYRNYVIRSPRRDTIRRALLDKDIECGLHYVPPVHRHPYYADRAASYPVADHLAGELLCLPCHPAMRDDDVHSVCDIVQGRTAG
jgi:dTDP-4-amino-4,6-dideoxygalactose transaminase